MRVTRQSDQAKLEESAKLNETRQLDIGSQPRKAERGKGAVAGRSAWGLLAGVGLLGSLAFGPVEAADRHAGYYYPIPATSETYRARAETFADSDRKRRIFFVTEMTNQMMKNPYPPPFALFAKGEEAEKLIITALHDDSYNTLYRMRGLLAILTARSRATPIRVNRLASRCRATARPCGPGRGRRAPVGRPRPGSPAGC